MTHSVFKDTLEGLKVQKVDRHGKYFWLRFHDSPKVALLHFGMTGWIKLKNIETHFIVMENGGDKKLAEIFQSAEAKKRYAEMDYKDVPDMEWPPKYHKFILKVDDGMEFAFTDPRRLGRVRLLDAEDDESLLSQEPLYRLGIDFSDPKDRWDFEKFQAEISRRRVALKTLLMDQSVFSGIGNWMADEVLYQSRIHPEQGANTLPDEQMQVLYDKVNEICEFVAQVEGNPAAFPEDFLMLYRWGKGRAKEIKTPQGYAVKHLTVGGRTSSYIPQLQKKYGGKPGTKRKDSDNSKTSKRKRVKEEED